MAGKGFADYPCAIAQGSTWGTAVVCTTGAGFPILSESISGPDLDEDESLTGNVWGNEPSLGNKSHGGTTDSWMRYKANSDFILALAMGTDATTAGANGYVHTMQVTDSNAKFATVIVPKDADVWEYDSAVVNQVTISGSAGGLVSLEPEFLCRNLSRNTSSGTNTNTTKANITTLYADSKGLDRLYFSQCRFRLNTGAGALDSDDELFPANFEIVLNNNFSTDFLADDANPKLLYPPTRQGRPSVTGFFEFPERSNQTFDDIFYDQTSFKLDMLFTSTTLIGGSTYFSVLFELPYCRMTNPDDAAVTGPERILNRVEFVSLEPSVAPTGMTATKPLYCEWTSDRQTVLIT